MDLRHSQTLLRNDKIDATEQYATSKAYANRSLDAYTLHRPLVATVESIQHCDRNKLSAVYLRNTNQIAIISHTGGSGENELDLSRRVKRLPLKSVDKRFSRQSFVCKSLSFSPDGTRIAVAQSDCIIYIYKLCDLEDIARPRLAATLKPTITGKFLCSSPVTCVAWTSRGIVFCSQDGKVKLVHLCQSSAPKVNSLYSYNKPVMPIALDCKWPLVAISFLDETVTLLYVQSDDHDSDQSERNQHDVRAIARIAHSSCAYCICVYEDGDLCICAGSDGKLTTYSYCYEPDPVSARLTYKFAHCIELREPIVDMRQSASNDMLAVCLTSRVVFVKVSATNAQLLDGCIQFADASLTSVCWACEGSKLLVSSLWGRLDAFACVQPMEEAHGHRVDSADGCVSVSCQRNNCIRIVDARNKSKNVTKLKTGRSILNVDYIDHVRNSALLVKTEANGMFVVNLDDMSQAEFTLPTVASQAEPIKCSFRHKGFAIIQLLASRLLVVVRLRPSQTRGVRNAGHTIACKIQLSSGVPLKGCLLCCRSYENHSHDKSNAMLAYVDECQDDCTVIAVNIVTNATLSVRIKAPVSYIDICSAAERILCVDVERRCYIHDVSDGSITTMLQVQNCAFARWMPQTNCLVIEQINTYLHELRILYNMSALHSKRHQIRIQLDRGCKIAGFERNHRIAITNGTHVDADETATRFYSLISSSESVQTVMSALGSDGPIVKSKRKFWHELGWLAIAREEARIAVNVFELLDDSDTALIIYLRRLVKAQDEGKTGEANTSLATLRGDWQQFEQFAEAELIVSTYKRLNKFTNLLAYYERTQQYRQRDLAEQRRREWLLSRGKHLEAARILANAGDAASAIDDLLNADRPLDAQVLLFETPEARTSKSLLERVQAALVEKGHFYAAARVSHRFIGDKQEAIELCERVGAFRYALDIAHKDEHLKGRYVLGLHAKLAERLTVQYESHEKGGEQALRCVLAAILHLKAANEFRRGLRLALEADQLIEASDLLEECRDAEMIDEDALQLAERLRANNELKRAARAYEIAVKADLALDCLIDAGDTQAAMRVAESLQGGQQTLIDIATRKANSIDKDMIDESVLANLEQLYVAVERADLAVELHKRLGREQRALELIELHQPDQLEGALLMLAREHERAQHYDMAERYLLRASPAEWTSVVRMHRLAQRWPDAYRVAREHCVSARDPLLVQLAYHWARSQAAAAAADGSGAAIELLERLDVTGEVIEFCCENKNFAFALELARASGDARRLANCVRRYATQLERDNKLELAEQVLVAHGELRAAVRMYLDNERPADGLRLLERQMSTVPLHASGDTAVAASEEQQQQQQQQQLASLLNETLLECASRATSFGEAEQMYVRAQQPELAVRMYVRERVWSRAVQCAQKYAPHLLEWVEREMDANVANDMGQIVAEAQRQRAPLQAAAAAGISVTPRSTLVNLAKQQQTQGQFSDATAAQLSTKVELRVRADESVRKGDLRSARDALGRLMEELANGSDGSGGGG